MNTFLHPITEHTSVTEGAKLLCVGGVGSLSVLYTDGRAAFIVQIDQQVIAPCLADDLRAVEGVDVFNTAHVRARADAVGGQPVAPLPAEQLLCGGSAEFRMYSYRTVPILICKTTFIAYNPLCFIR